MHNFNVSKNLNTISYLSGKKERQIPKHRLESIRSRVTTHEGEFLTGKEGRKYMDKYSKRYLGKDLAGSYRDTTIK